MLNKFNQYQGFVRRRVTGITIKFNAGMRGKDTDLHKLINKILLVRYRCGFRFFVLFLTVRRFYTHFYYDAGVQCFFVDSESDSFKM